MSASEHQPQTPDTEQLRHDDNLRTPFDEQGQLTAEYLNELTETTLDAGTVNAFKNKITQDYVLGNFKDEEVSEEKWLSRVDKEQLVAEHPDHTCVWTGAYRQYLFDDTHENLQPLSDREERTIREFIRGIHARVTRSRDGWQQDKIGEQVKVSRVEEQNQGGDGGLLNIFS